MTKYALSFLLACLMAPGLWAQSDEDIQRRFEKMEERIRQLEAEIARLKGEKEAAPPAGEPAEADPEPQEEREPPMAEVLVSAATRVPEAERETPMPYSGYMEFHLNKPEDQPAIADFHRFVLLFGHSFNDRIQFWSELELEHALVEGAEESGELELEQAFLDFRVQPWLNFRGGVVLAPVGLINERHEPPTFNGVERPFVDTFIIPTTWFDPGVGIFGDLGKGFTYKAYVMSPLNSSMFSAEEGLAEGPQSAFMSVTQNPAFTGRLEYHGIPRLSLGTSFWTGKSGFATPGINPRVNLFEFDGRYSVSRFDFRGEFAQVTIDKTARLNSLLQRTSGVNPNIAERLRGYYGEIGLHLLPIESRYDLVGFFRYENFDTQNEMAPGFLPLKEFDRDAFVSGFSFFPEPDVALKFDWTVVRNESNFIKAPNSFNFGIGWWF